MTDMLAAYAAQCCIDNVDTYPISYYWDLVSQGINKGNMVSGGGLQMQTEASKQGGMVARAKARIEKLKAEGKWQKTG